MGLNLNNLVFSDVLSQEKANGKSLSSRIKTVYLHTLKNILDTSKSTRKTHEFTGIPSSQKQRSANDSLEVKSSLPYVHSTCKQ